MLPAAAKWLAKIAQRTQTWVDDMITPEKCRQIIDAAIEPMVNLREGGTVDSLLKKADELDKHADAMYLNASLIGMPQAADAAVVDVLQRAQRILESIQADMLLK
jgi:hypothetical protein